MLTHLVGMWAEAEVLDSLAVALWTTEEDDVRAGRSTHSELVEGDALASSLQNASAGSRGEAQSAHGYLRHLI